LFVTAALPTRLSIEISQIRTHVKINKGEKFTEALEDSVVVSAGLLPLA
jgi:hypothetical protein